MYSFPQQHQFGYPTQFASYPQFAQAVPASSASAHEGSQAGEQAASHSVSGFAGQPIDAGFGAFYGQPTFIGGAPAQATFIGGAPQYFGAQQATYLPQQATYLPQQATYLPQQQLVHVAAPQIRRPGYNERLVAWRNRQKAFNRYKQQTKEAIKTSNHHHYAAQQQVYGAAPVFGQQTIIGAPAYGYGQQTFIGAPAAYGATYIGAQQYGFPGQYIPYAGEIQQQADGQEFANDFTSYSSGQEVQAQEEPEIRGTQV